MLAEDVTSEWLSSVLGGDVGPIGQQRIGDGHIGVNVRVAMPEAEASLPRSVVVKLPATDETSLTTAAMLRHYERETRFYTELASTIDMRVPACLHGDWTAATNAFVLVLEDMAPATQGDQLTGCTLEQARDAVRELAKLHGPRWDDPTLYDIDWIEHDKGDDEAGAGLTMMWQMFFPGFAGTYRSHMSADEFELAERFGSVIGTWRGGRARGRRRSPTATTGSTTCCSPPRGVGRRSPSSTGRPPLMGARSPTCRTSSALGCCPTIAGHMNVISLRCISKRSGPTESPSTSRGCGSSTAGTRSLVSLSLPWPPRSSR